MAFVSGLVAAGVLAASLLGPATKGHADTDSAVPAGLGDSACPAAVNGLNLTTATIPELRAALDSGEISSRELVEGYLARVDALNRRGPKLKPVITTAPDALEQAEAADAARAAGAAQGPLAGIPILLKDNVDTTDFQTTAGAKAMLGPAPPLDAFLTSRLREAGAIVLGKANIDEWATEIDPRQPKGFSDVGGRIRNPYTNGDPSGSSGGPAVSAASGLAASTVGTETAGSIILPSYVNSAVGIKPTRGLISRGGVIPLLGQNDTPGPIDQNVTDSAVMLGLMTGVDPRDPVTAKQIGHSGDDYTRLLDANALQGARIGIQKPVPVVEDGAFEIPGLGQIRSGLEAAGATVVKLDETLRVTPGGPREVHSKLSLPVPRPAEPLPPPAGSHLPSPLAGGRGGVQPSRWPGGGPIRAIAPDRGRAAAPPGPPPPKSRLADVKTASRRALTRALDRNDLDALAVSPGASSITNTSAGYPAVTVPAGYLGGAPFGAILTGRKWSEPDLIGYAYAFEQATKAWRSPADLNQRFAEACPS